MNLKVNLSDKLIKFQYHLRKTYTYLENWVVSQTRKLPVATPHDVELDENPAEYTLWR